MKSDPKGLLNPQFIPRVLVMAIVIAAVAFIGRQALAERVNAHYVTGVEVPVSSVSFTAAGKDVDLALNFAPVAGQNLTLVRNTGPQFIQGEFNNLAHGQIVALQFQGVTFHFVANYYGGDGKDLVLMPIRLDDLSDAARAKLNDVLVLALKKSRGQAPFDRATSLRPEVVEKDGTVLVDIQASFSGELLNQIAQLGVEVNKNWQTSTSVRGWVPLAQLEAVANLAGIQSISAATLTVTRHLPRPQ